MMPSNYRIPPERSAVCHMPTSSFNKKHEKGGEGWSIWVKGMELLFILFNNFMTWLMSELVISPINTNTFHKQPSYNSQKSHTSAASFHQVASLRSKASDLMVNSTASTSSAQDIDVDWHISNGFMWIPYSSSLQVRGIHSWNSERMRKGLKESFNRPRTHENYHFIWRSIINITLIQLGHTNHTS